MTCTPLPPVSFGQLFSSSICGTSNHFGRIPRLQQRPEAVWPWVWPVLRDADVFAKEVFLDFAQRHVYQSNPLFGLLARLRSEAVLSAGCQSVILSNC